jgi:serine/threonine protein kinase
MQWVLEDFVIKRTIGRGQAGYIYLALHIPTAKTYALKTCNQLDTFGKTLLRLEIQNHKYLTDITRDDEESIIELYDSFKVERRSWCLVLEYAPLGDLHTRLVNQVCKCFSDTVAADYVRQIAQALNFCHRHCVIHRDVKLENIFLAEDGTIRLGKKGSLKGRGAPRLSAPFL